MIHIDQTPDQLQPPAPTLSAAQFRREQHGDIIIARRAGAPDSMRTEQVGYQHRRIVKDALELRLDHRCVPPPQLYSLTPQFATRKSSACAPNAGYNAFQQAEESRIWIQLCRSTTRASARRWATSPAALRLSPPH